MREQGYSFNPEETSGIINRFGADFFKHVAGNLAIFCEKWQLTELALIPSFSANLVFTCTSDLFGDAVIKIGDPNSAYIETEFQALCAYGGRPFCKVFDVDRAGGALLEERIFPGTQLRKVDSMEERAERFCSLYKGLHIQPPKDGIAFPTYSRWVERITEYMRGKDDCRELYGHMEKACNLYRELSAKYNQRMLLHGDFHHDNILLSHDGSYVIIDPKGVIGDPLFDVPRFMLNEFEDQLTPELAVKLTSLIGLLERKLDIPGSVLRTCLYVETVMGMCWSAEDGAGPEEYIKLLETAAFAEALLQTREGDIPGSIFWPGRKDAD
ncbi:aminoglycoside phosphotransferase family protein [Paenibacillus sp. CAU 1782]